MIQYKSLKHDFKKKIFLKIIKDVFFTGEIHIQGTNDEKILILLKRIVRFLLR